MVDTVGIGGMKLSGELVQLDFQEMEVSRDTLLGYLRDVASARISIPHFHYSQTGAATQITLCVAARDFSGVPRGLDCSGQAPWSRVLPSVATLSLFPHRHDLSLGARVMDALGRRAIPVYGISSSISNLVIHTKGDRIDEAAQAVQTVCRLPANHTPLRPVVLLGGEAVQTTAVYWEPKIGIYGMETLTGLSLLRLRCCGDAAGNLLWLELGALSGKFRLLLDQQDHEDGRLLCLLIDAGQKQLLTAVQERVGRQAGVSLSVDQDQEMVTFHGPHFQERYGIAGMVFVALRDCGIRPVAAGCTGTSINVIVGAGMARHVVECLRNICVIPG